MAVCILNSMLDHVECEAYRVELHAADWTEKASSKMCVEAHTFSMVPTCESLAFFNRYSNDKSGVNVKGFHRSRSHIFVSICIVFDSNKTET